MSTNKVVTDLGIKGVVVTVTHKCETEEDARMLFEAYSNQFTILEAKSETKQ